MATLPEKHAGGVTEPEAVKLWMRLLTCSMTIEKRVRRRLADQFETTLPRFDVLAALDRNPKGLNMGQLSQALLVSGGNLTALVRQLEKQGLLEMKKGAERRPLVDRPHQPARQAAFRRHRRRPSSLDRRDAGRHVVRPQPCRSTACWPSSRIRSRARPGDA